MTTQTTALDEAQQAERSALVDATLRDVRFKLRGTPTWRELRCQTCHGLGTVEDHAHLRMVDEDGTANGEGCGECVCGDCGGWGVGVRTLVQHIDCGPLCETCGDPRDTSVDVVRLA